MLSPLPSQNSTLVIARFQSSTRDRVASFYKSRNMDRYLLLDHALPKNHVPNMLGRVVVDKADPLRHYVPTAVDDVEEFHPSDIVADISDEFVEYNDLQGILDTAQNTEAKVRLSQLLRGYAFTKTSKDVMIKAAVVKRYDMTNIGQKLTRLMQDERYKKQVTDLLRKTRGEKDESLPFVTGMLTCGELEVEEEIDKGRGVGFQLKVPVGETVGGPDAVDPEVEVQNTSSSANKFGAKIKAEVIFALAYDEVKLQRYFTKKCLGRKAEVREPEVVTGEKILGDGINLYFGSTAGNVCVTKGSDTESSDGDEGTLVEKGSLPGKSPFTLYCDSATSSFIL